MVYSSFFRFSAKEKNEKSSAPHLTFTNFKPRRDGRDPDPGLVPDLTIF
jgi:hypothetical protein